MLTHNWVNNLLCCFWGSFYDPRMWYLKFTQRQVTESMKHIQIRLENKGLDQASGVITTQRSTKRHAV